jgi:hypothetical protein
MSTQTVSSVQTAHGRARSRRAPATQTTRQPRPRQAGSRASGADIVVRIPGAQDAHALAELAQRAGAAAPQGGLMVAAQDGRLLAAIGTATGEAIADATPAGCAAEGVLRHRVAQLHRRRTNFRRPGTPS